MVIPLNGKLPSMINQNDLRLRCSLHLIRLVAKPGHSEHCPG